MLAETVREFLLPKSLSGFCGDSFEKIVPVGQISFGMKAFKEKISGKVTESAKTKTKKNKTQFFETGVIGTSHFSRFALSLEASKTKFRFSMQFLFLKFENEALGSGLQFLSAYFLGFVFLGFPGISGDQETYFQMLHTQFQDCGLKLFSVE